jgi:hypothetical protein
MRASQDADGWIRVHFRDSSGQSSLGLELRARLDRPLNAQDEKRIARAMGDLERELLAESARLHPDNVEWKRQWLEDAQILFSSAGLAPIYVQEIDNRYCGPLCCPHRVWLRVTTRLGVLVVGWRKHVLAIDWSESDVEVGAEELFAEEGVTKSEKMIHAWNYKEATKYLKKLAAWRRVP